MKKIMYIKTFLSGLLKGLSIPVDYKVPDDSVAHHCRCLSIITQKNPGCDAITKSQYYVTDVRVEEVSA